MLGGGRIIVLNGPSSAGKTTLAHAVAAHLDPTCAALSVDQIYPFVAPGAPDRFARLNDALVAGAIALARRDLDVVIDTVFETPAIRASIEGALGGVAHALVALDCPLPILETRERARGDRRPGLARDQRPRVLRGDHHRRIDTSRTSIDDAVASVVDLFRALPL